MTKYVYKIDENVIAMLNGVDDEAKKQELYNEYLKNLGMLKVTAQAGYLREKGIADEQITAYEDLIAGEIEPDAVTAKAEELKPVSELLTSDEYIDYVDALMNSFNKGIYDEKVPTLTEEQIDQINKYLEEQDKVDNTIRKAYLAEMERALKDVHGMEVREENGEMKMVKADEITTPQAAPDPQPEAATVAEPEPVNEQAPAAPETASTPAVTDSASAPVESAMPGIAPEPTLSETTPSEPAPSPTGPAIGLTGGSPFSGQSNSTNTTATPEVVKPVDSYP